MTPQPNRRPVSRRQLLGFGLGTAAAGLLAGCAVPGSTNVNKAALVPAAASGQKVELT
jgi:multiple sugar transport system substrate-binding protein